MPSRHSRPARQLLSWLLVAALCLIPAALAARWWAGHVEQQRNVRLRQLARAPVDARSPRDSALDQLGKAAQERPWDPDTWYWLGDRFARLGHNNEAVNAF